MESITSGSDGSGADAGSSRRASAATSTSAAAKRRSASRGSRTRPWVVAIVAVRFDGRGDRPLDLGQALGELVVAGG